MENEQKIVEEVVEAVAEESATASDSLEEEPTTVTLSTGKTYTFEKAADLPFRKRQQWLRRYQLFWREEGSDKSLEAEIEMACLSAQITKSVFERFSDEDQDLFYDTFMGFLVHWYVRPSAENAEQMLIESGMLDAMKSAESRQLPSTLV